jgi:uncharacterized tellurite resistance protein B-like protein
MAGVDEVKDKIVALIIPVFEGVIEERREHYKTHPRPQASEVEGLIASCSNTNGVISGASGMLPGVVGLVAILPELRMTIGNQVKMVYDIGVANGKEHEMSKEMILTLAMKSGVGSAGINALARQGEKILIKKASVKAVQQLARAFGVKLSASVVRTSVAKFVPALGGIAIGVWVRYTTKMMGENSDAILSREIDVVETDEMEVDMSEDGPLDGDALYHRTVVLMNLMRSDGEVKEVERQYLEQIIDKEEFTFIQKAKLKVDVRLSSMTTVDWDKLRSMAHADKLALIVDMLALAKRDGQVHVNELKYLLEVCDELGMDSAFAVSELGFNQNAAAMFLGPTAVVANDILHVADPEQRFKAQFYTNDRVFLFDQGNKVLNKGTYKVGGRMIRYDDGRSVRSDDVVANLLAGIVPAAPVDAQPGAVQPSPSPAGVEPDPMQRIKQLKELLDMGAIDRNEFESKKQELLGRL